MLVPESNVFLADQYSHHSTDIILKIISPDGLTYIAYFLGDTLIEEVKNKGLNHFYPNGVPGSSRFKLVRVSETTTLHEFYTVDQEALSPYEELLLVERRVPDASSLWNLGCLRSPQYNTIISATAYLPPAQNSMRQPNLQSLLSTNDMSFELRKILISLVEAGARLAAAGNNYELSLDQLTAALVEPQAFGNPPATPNAAGAFEELALKLIVEAERNYVEISTTSNVNKYEPLKRAACLQQFLDKFKDWRLKVVTSPDPDATVILQDLGFSEEESKNALCNTGNNMPAAASYLIGERGSSVFELLNGLPDGYILQTLLKQPQIQRGLLNTRMLIAFIAMIGKTGNSNLWINSHHGNPLLSHISRTYHSEKYCMAVNQFSKKIKEPQKLATSDSNPGPSTSF